MPAWLVALIAFVANLIGRKSGVTEARVDDIKENNIAAQRITQAESAAPADRAATIVRLRDGAGL